MTSEEPGGTSWHWLWLVPALAVVLAPPMTWGVQAAAAVFGGPSWLEAAGFGRVFNRILLVGAVTVGGTVLWRRGYRSGAALGWVGPGSLAVWGFLWGVPAVGLLFLVQLGAGVRVVDDVPGPGVVLGGLLTGWVVSALEEPLFRGVLLGELRRRMPTGRAVWVSAAVFAAVHFINPHGFGKEYQAHWWSGLELLWAAVRQFGGDPSQMLRGVQLVLLGWLLGMSVVRWGSVAWAMGLHAVLVWGLQVMPRFTDYEGGPSKFWFPREAGEGIDAVGVVLLMVVGWKIYRRMRDGDEKGIARAA